MSRLNKVFVKIITCAYLTIASTPGAFSKPANVGGPATARLSLADWESYNLRDIDGNAGTYAFGYDVDDPETGNTQYRDEQRYPNGTVIGSYGYVDARGHPVQVHYIADEKGYRILTNKKKLNTWNSNHENTNTNQMYSQMINYRRPQTPASYNHYPGMTINPQYLNRNNLNDHKMNTLPIAYTQRNTNYINSGFDTSAMSEFGKRGNSIIAMKHRIANPKFMTPSSRRSNINNDVLYTPLYNIPA